MDWTFLKEAAVTRSWVAHLNVDMGGPNVNRGKKGGSLNLTNDTRVESLPFRVVESAVEEVIAKFEWMMKVGGVKSYDKIGVSTRNSDVWANGNKLKVGVGGGFTLPPETDMALWIKDMTKALETNGYKVTLRAG